MTSKTAADEYEKLKISLEDNLSARGLVEDVFTDKLDEYMRLWKRFHELDADVEARGVSVMDERRGMMVENRSVSLAVQVSRQMLAIFKALGLQEEACTPSQGDDDDAL